MGLGEVGKTTTLHSSTWDEKKHRHEGTRRKEDGEEDGSRQVTPQRRPPSANETQGEREPRGAPESFFGTVEVIESCGSGFRVNGPSSQSAVSESFGIPKRFSARSQLGAFLVAATRAHRIP